MTITTLLFPHYTSTSTTIPASKLVFYAARLLTFVIWRITLSRNGAYGMAGL